MGSVQAAAMALLYPLLFLVFYNACDASQSICLLDSGQECQRTSLDNEGNKAIFQCDLEERPAEDRVKEFDEWETINITAAGDWSGDGCSFEINNEAKKIKCCYIPEPKEGQRIEEEGRELCTEPVQPKECRKRGKESGQFEVIEKPHRIGYCILTLYEGRPQDSGVYKVTFPLSQEPDPNRNITVRVKPVGHSTVVLASSATAGVLAGLLVLLGLGFWLLVFLRKRDEANRKSDEKLIAKLKAGKDQEFPEAFAKKGPFGLWGRKSILSLRDPKLNNIYHLAARADWSENMTKMVLDRKKKEDTEAPLNIGRTTIFDTLKLKPYI